MIPTFRKNNLVKNIFVLTLENKICFPGVMSFFEVDKKEFEKLSSKNIFLCFKKDGLILEYGVIARILDFEIKEDKVYLVVQGVLKGKIFSNINDNKVNVLIEEDEKYIKTKSTSDLINKIKLNSSNLIKKFNFIPKDIIYSFSEVKNLNILSYVLAYNLNLNSELSVMFLKESKLEKRLEFLNKLSHSML